MKDESEKVCHKTLHACTRDVGTLSTIKDEDVMSQETTGQRNQHIAKCLQTEFVKAPKDVPVLDIKNSCNFRQTGMNKRLNNKI